MIKSKLTAKSQTTIPQPVRNALDLRPGDELTYEIEGSRVVLAKMRSEHGADDPFRTFSEWNSEADYRAHVDL
ncbi:MAG: type II toxin-antitoxin system PrlF family antitoxin [Acetobacteraceae bacterium]